MLRAKVHDFSGDFAIHITCINHIQHFILMQQWLGFIQKPQLARYGTGIEEVTAYVDHQINMAGFDQLLAHFASSRPTLEALRRHYKNLPGPFYLNNCKNTVSTNSWRWTLFWSYCAGQAKR